MLTIYVAFNFAFLLWLKSRWPDWVLITIDFNYWYSTPTRSFTGELIAAILVRLKLKSITSI
jgi:hypothetical protein